MHGVDLDTKPGPRSSRDVGENQGSTYWISDVFYQQLFAKGPRSKYFEVARGHNLAGVQADQATDEVTTQKATQAFHAKFREDGRKWMKASEEVRDLAAPNSDEIW